MKEAYPIIMSKGKEYIIVYVPDFDANTQGKTVAEAMEMARDLIGILGIDMQDDGKEQPKASSIDNVQTNNGTVTLVDVDFDEYRRKIEMRSVKKNCTIPSWLNYKAEKANINFSNVLQNALMKELNIS